MSNIQGNQINDWLLLAGLGVGAYFLYKAVVKPVSDVTQGVANIATSAVKPVENLVAAVTTPNTVTGIPDIITPIPNMVADIVASPIGQSIGNDLFSTNTSTGIPNIITPIPNLIGDVISSITTPQAPKPNVDDTVYALDIPKVNDYSPFSSDTSTGIPDIITPIPNLIADAIPAVGDFVSGIVHNVEDTASNAWNAITSWF